MKLLIVTVFFLCIQFMPSSTQKAPSPSPSLSLNSNSSSIILQEEHCWKKISKCIKKNMNKSKSDPKFDPSSKLFNETEHFCCILVHQTASADKTCFCSVSTFFLQNPSRTPQITRLLSICSFASLSTFCIGMKNYTYFILKYLIFY